MSETTSRCATINRCPGQAAELLLGHLPSLVRLCKFTLEEGDFLDKTLSIFRSRC
jgi:hypothetical protein